jgi:hypothetical protein
MVKLIISSIIFVFSLNQCQGQLFTDTLFSGKSKDIDLSGSIIKSLSDSLQIMTSVIITIN